MSMLRELFNENPMMIEIVRFKRKFIGGNAANSIVLAMVVLIYACILMLVWVYREDANPIIIVFLQTAIFTLLAPAMLHGAIAGERERRSWDFLLVAPVSKAQIITGRFMGAATAILVCAAAFLVPILIGTFFYRPYAFYGGSLSRTALGTGGIWNLAEAELVSVTWGLLVCALTILFSARCRRGFVALGATLFLLVGSLIVWPILIVAARLTGAGGTFLNFFHPFWTLTQIESANARPDYLETSAAFFGIPQIVTYALLTVLLLVWSERTLRFADSEVKFLPQQKDA
jgi:ABC-type transport system involved in multi-copper enzyme maturation permease subunit